MKKYLTVACAFLVAASCRNPKPPASDAAENGYAVPPVEDIVVYEVFVRNFTAEGTFNAVIPHLDRLKKLGVNVLWLMPIQPTGVERRKGTFGSPYAISDYTAVHPQYGTKEDFRRLVDSIHAKNMYVIIDEVANHTAWDHPWITQHPDWYTKDSTGKIIPSVPDWTDIADLNFDHPDMRAEQIRCMKYWVDSFHIDGYRCDVAEMVPVDFWKECIAELRKSRPLILLAEGADPALYEAGFDLTYGWDVYHALKKVWSGRAGVSLIDSVLQAEKKRYPVKYRPIRFITNHDENSWDDVPQNKFINMDGAKAAWITSMTLPGTPLMYNGQESGFPERINLFEKYSIDWNANADLQEWYGKTMEVYRGSDVLKKGALEGFSSLNGQVLMYRRELPGRDPVWVIVNTSGTATEVVLPEFWQRKHFRDLVTGEKTGAETAMNLKPYEARMLVTE